MAPISPMLDRRAHPTGLTTASWMAADGWQLRRLDWPADDERRRLLFLSGRADFGEKYLEAMAHWHRQGWSVTSFDWRGQGGSRVADAAEAPMSALLDDLAGFVAGWALAGAPGVVVAHSMGGHLALRLIVERGWRPTAAVLVAPMLGINSGPLPRWLARAVALGVLRLGWGQRHVLTDPKGLRETFLSGSRERIEDARWWKAANPGWAVGPPRWGWVADALASIVALEQAGLPVDLPPMLFLLAGRERLVSNRATRRFAARVRGEVKMLPDARHEILREGDTLRGEAMTAIDAFLARVK